MKIEVLVVSPFEQNARILICEKTKQAILLDPGDEADRFLDKIEEYNLLPQYILATHGHIDHIAAVHSLQKKLSIPFYIHKDDEDLVKSVVEQGNMFGISDLEVPKIDRYIQEGDIFTLGEYSGKAIHTPGHSRGGVSFLFGDDLFVGDVLFAGSIGRTDLPGGNFNILKKSIQEKLYTLPSQTRVHPGHGDSTTIGHEKRNNPYVRGL